MVVRPAVNRDAVGSSPTFPANYARQALLAMQPPCKRMTWGSIPQMGTNLSPHGQQPLRAFSCLSRIIASTMPTTQPAKRTPHMDQTFINWALGILGMLGGFLLNAVWQSVKDLQEADKELAEKVASVDKLVAGDYVRRDEFQDMTKALFSKLDRIEDKVDRKIDK